jgi:MYXO-CTERM domain-containing protein
MILLMVALAGIVTFAQGLRLVDTVGLLMSGALAGAALAALAAHRRR